MTPITRTAFLTAISLSLFTVAPLQAQTTRRSQTRPTTTFTNDPATAARLLELGSRNIRVHDPSTIVKCKNEYWLFATGRGVASHRSKDLKKWEPGPPVIRTRPAWTLQAVPGHRGGEQGHYWAPDIIHLNNRYLLYYSVSTFGRNTSAIGLATNPTLDPEDPNFKWTDHGPVIQSKSGKDNFNAIDPAVTLDADGKLWLSFGSFWSGIKMIELDPATGKRIAEDSAIHSLAYVREIEAPFIYHHDNHYYLLLNWGICCRGTSSTYNIRVGRSPKITGPYLDKEGKDLQKGGGSLLLATQGPFIGPGHPAILKEGNTHYLSMHFYDPTRQGAGTLAIRPLHWDNQGWPIVDDPHPN